MLDFQCSVLHINNEEFKGSSHSSIFRFDERAYAAAWNVAAQRARAKHAEELCEFVQITAV